MKKGAVRLWRRRLCLALLASVGAAAAGPAAVPGSAPPAAAGRNPAGPAPVVVLGDSLTEGGWWSSNFAAARIVNHGVSGDTTTGMLARLDAVLAARPSAVFLMAGINDLLRGRPVADVLRNYERLLERLGGDGRRLVVQSTLFVAPPSNVDVNPRVRLLDDGLRRICAARRDCAYIDLNRVVAPQGVLEAAFTEDGLHLNTAGYRAWFRELKRERLLR